MRKKKNGKSPTRAVGMSRAEFDEQRISFAWGNAPEGSYRWVTRASLRRAAANRVLLPLRSRPVSR